jgi:hypothetical protein
MKKWGGFTKMLSFFRVKYQKYLCCCIFAYIYMFK